MRVPLLLTLFFLTKFSAFGQSDPLKGNWINANNEVIITNDIGAGRKTIDVYTNNNPNRLWDHHLYLSNDTLRFGDHYLKILKLSDTLLIFEPLSETAKALFDQRTKLHFIKQQYNRDTSVKLERIIFNSSDCAWGGCPQLHFEIKSNREIIYNDTSSQGSFRGILNEQAYSDLELLLQTCNLRL